MKSSVLFSILFQIVVVSVASGQTSWKSWNTAQVNLSLTKKLDLRLSHMRAFDLSNGFQPDFNQTSLHASYDLTRHLDIAAGYVKGGSNTLTDGSSRVTARIGYKIRIMRVLNWTNSIQGEQHSASETRYRNRVVLNSRLALRKRLGFLHLLPSASYSLFYNMGGNPIQYYDAETGLATVKQTPDGFHRGRLMLNLNSKISDHFSLSVYYMAQREFNLLTPDARKINIVKPATGKLVRAFDDFNTAGLTLSYDINLYHSNKN